MSAHDVHHLVAAGNLTASATEALTRLIPDGEYAPKARLPTEFELGRRFDVSRTVVREAAAGLKSAGLVHSRQGSNLYLREPHGAMRFQLDPGEVHPSLAAVLEILELRRSIEPEASALAAERYSRTQVTGLRRALDAIAREEQAGCDGVLADMKLHLAIARRSSREARAATIRHMGHAAARFREAAPECWAGGGGLEPAALSSRGPPADKRTRRKA